MVSYYVAWQQLHIPHTQRVWPKCQLRLMACLSPRCGRSLFGDCERGSGLSSGVPETRSKTLTFSFTADQEWFTLYFLKGHVSLPVSDIGKLKEDADEVVHILLFLFSSSRLRFSVSWVTRTSFSFMEPCWNPPTMALSQVRHHVCVCVC